MDQKAIKQRLETLAKLKANLEMQIKEEKESVLSGLLFPRPQNSGKTPVKNEKKANAVKADTKVMTAKEEEDLAKKIAYLKKRDKLSDTTFFDKVKPLLDQIPESNGSRYYDKIKANIGIIADEFLYNSFKDVAEFKYIERDNYKKHSGSLDVLLIVTAWKGLNLEWKGLGNPNIKKHREDLYKIIEFYRSQGTKIVFYSKEDPVNYHIFIDIAKKCDYIFTTAEEKLEDYRRECQNENVFVLEFGINPRYHNPIGIKMAPKQREVLFTGSWYEKYPHRHVDTRMLFDGVIDAGRDLKIIDRNYELKLMQYFFPEEYLKYVSPSIEHSYLQKFHKIFDWAINLNTVKESNTMFANRVYELQALGNILLSNYSVGVNNKFPNVFLVNDQKEVNDIINRFSEEDVFEHQVRGIRRVMTHETSFHRIHHLLEKVGLDFPVQERKVAVIAASKSGTIEEMFNQQTYPNKELFLESQISEEQLQDYDFVAFFDESKLYGEFYLEDMINAFKYTNSDFVTKDAYYAGDSLIKGVEHNYTTSMKDKYRTVFWSKAYTLKDLMGFNSPATLPNGYSIDRFEFNDQPVQKEVAAGQKYKLSVIIPTYNNGDHLLNKCFNSLRRSSLFNDMEIIMVDDGSTDGYTPKIIKSMERKYSNVKTFFYNDGGSGSASRPRNKGFLLSTAPYITYLDPDNEAINDGYNELYKQLAKGNYDMVVGNMLRLDTKPLNFDYYRTAVQYNGSDVISKNIKEYMVKSQFKAMSIQALICKREVIGDQSLRMVEGAVGQDTIFFQELLLHSKKTKAINLPIHIYYAAVSGSAVNTISKRFFEKYYILEKYRVNMLKENGLLQDYIEKRFEYYFTNWYLKKLKLVNEEDALESIRILGEILGMYEINDAFTSPEMVEFSRLLKQKDYHKVEAQFVG
ncbi:glycosyltransferase [Neobacillus sp. PS2-9]|uniref:glycosyltransferase n=1 Tax=Neobacillus sp. PS2-9 TaxID=3070676 RepID=UPI0027E164DA|nr:glycosyltransferase [Neobacillus sp. PS2-9]WML58599.1 glycosyltransferase [Neobacillus sp. PS2-9]